jgi:multisubunit Na+/H+ antiporter MnhG subunit
MFELQTTKQNGQQPGIYLKQQWHHQERTTGLGYVEHESGVVLISPCTAFAFLRDVLLSAVRYPLTAPVSVRILHRERWRPPCNHLQKDRIS